MTRPKRLHLAAVAFAGVLNAAYAAPNQRTVIFGGSHPPGTVADLNFSRGQYLSPKGPLSTTRASIGTNLLPTSPNGASYTTFPNNVARITPGLGDLVEESRTDFLLNATAPATQTTGSLANGTYTLWVNGSGSATMSTPGSGAATGCGTAAATQGTSASFTLTGTAGGCTVTVAGSLNEFQLEKNPGTASCPTSFIPTAGATVTRAADVASVSIPSVANPSLWVSGTPECPGSYANAIPAAMWLSTNTFGAYLILERNPSAGTLEGVVNGASTVSAGAFPWAQNTLAKAAATLTGTNLAVSFNAGAPASAAYSTNPSLDTLGVGNLGGLVPWNGYVSREIVSSQPLSAY